MELKAQASVEYLMTYSWMLVVVAIATGTIYSLIGSEAQVDRVSGLDDIPVNDQTVNQNSGLLLDVRNPNRDATIKEVTVQNPDSTRIDYRFDNTISEDGIINLPGVNPSTSENELEINITYAEEGFEDLETTGQITGGLQVDQSFDGRTIVMDGLVGYWPLGEKYSSEDTVYDLTGDDIHNEKIEDPSFVDSSVGDAIEFDGEKDYLTTSSHNLKFQDATFMAWIMPRKYGSEDHRWYPGLFIGEGGSWGQVATLSDAGDDKATIEFREGGTTSQARSNEFEQIFEWFHIAIVTKPEDSETSSHDFKFYVNGEFVGKGVHDDYDPWRISDMAIGYGGSTNNGRFDGKWFSAKFFDRSLNEEEIETIYESSKP